MTKLIELSTANVAREELAKHVVVLPAKYLSDEKYLPYRDLNEVFRKVVHDRQLFCSPRGKELEEDVSLVQLATYVALIDEDAEQSAFAYARGTESERRLDNNESIGFGGHVEVKDLLGGLALGLNLLDCISQSIERELKEEAPQLQSSSRPLFVTGLHVCDETAAPVDRVHLGLCYVGRAKRVGDVSGDVGAIKSYTMEQLWGMRRDKKLERWSRDVLQFVQLNVAAKVKKDE